MRQRIGLHIIEQINGERRSLISDFNLVESGVKRMESGSCSSGVESSSEEVLLSKPLQSPGGSMGVDPVISSGGGGSNL